ncbi:TPA: hypothetical protein ROG05_000652 [Enterobacter soli]|jgi:hypothetical protein|uniref:CS1 type fimbrial major subunit n=1 Tax=Enterobacter quasiroggenkampii TaxID=2497436 RepID=UPI002004804D|nr:CS1 type fimbrial major subunit [Enterobacter quasiroggenkampii]MCK7310586.1 fimbrial protein [Enterobacter quasiroggenkampii]HDX4048304.1 hypothetical protein [Enterobacter soli]
MKLITKAVMAGLLCISTSVMADEETSLDFTVEAHIPDHRYYVKYSNPAFGATPQKMIWDQNLEVLNNLSTDLQAKNSKGKISAYLLQAAELEHDSIPANNIPLTVSIAGQTLQAGPTNSVEIVDQASAANETTIPLVVSPTGTPAYEAGDYQADVTLMFDHEVV